MWSLRSSPVQILVLKNSPPPTISFHYFAEHLPLPLLFQDGLPNCSLIGCPASEAVTLGMDGLKIGRDYQKEWQGIVNTLSHMKVVRECMVRHPHIQPGLSLLLLNKK